MPKGKRVAWICGICHTFNKEVDVCKKCHRTPDGKDYLLPMDLLYTKPDWDTWASQWLSELVRRAAGLCSDDKHR